MSKNQAGGLRAGAPTILLVEDEPAVRRLFTKVLDAVGATVDFLAKPFSAPTLLAKVREILDRA